MTTTLELLIHAANLLYLFAFMVRDILWLRVLTVFAAVCLIPYFYFRPEPLMTPIYWNLVFTALNIFWIGRLLLERRAVNLSEEEERLCELVFRTMTPREMIKILKLATWEEAAAGECFVDRGKPLERLMVIYSGKACVDPLVVPVHGFQLLHQRSDGTVHIYRFIREFLNWLVIALVRHFGSPAAVDGKGTFSPTSHYPPNSR